ncbi:unnamed protein product [[Candida] boidinii]|nr:unnamed protein product [[Candida] boidinii]
MEHPCWTLSALSVIGGAMAYSRKRSVPSLVGGLTVGTLYAVAGYLLKENMEYGIHTALGASTILFMAGVSRGVKTKFKAPVPIMLIVLGGFSTYYYAGKYSEFYL